MELDNILDDLEASNYETQSFIIPASAVGAPHRRERVWIIANAVREQRSIRNNIEQNRKLSSHWQRDISTSKERWANIFPESWETFNVEDWFGYNVSNNQSNRIGIHTKTIKPYLVGQKPNPHFLEWMMGYPTGWTEIKL